jgi:hypothetical protein
MGSVLAQMKFDFTNFTAKVSELNRLHKSLHELSDLRWRTQKAEDIARWEKVGSCRLVYHFGGEYSFLWFL